jgi:hypothetical protein
VIATAEKARRDGCLRPTNDYSTGTSQLAFAQLRHAKHREAATPKNKQINGSTKKEEVCLNLNSIFVSSVAFCKTSSRFGLKHLLEWPIEICIERIRLVCVCRKVAPMFIHPEPGRWVLSHIRFKRIPTCLRDLLMGHTTSGVDLWVEDKPVTPIRQRFAMRGNYRDAGALVQPDMCGSHACL